MLSTIVLLLLVQAAPHALAGSDALAQAEVKLAELEYEQARELLLEALVDPHLDDAQRVNAHLSLGIVSRIVERDVDARLHFLRALRIDPYAKLPEGQPPKIALFFSLIQKEVHDEIRTKKLERLARINESSVEQERIALAAERKAMEATERERQQRREEQAYWAKRRARAQVSLNTAKREAEAERSAQGARAVDASPASDGPPNATGRYLSAGVGAVGVVLLVGAAGVLGAAAATSLVDAFDTAGLPLLVAGGILVPLGVVFAVIGAGAYAYFSFTE